jgi:alkylation response protein AidB-like acyl-CoA dehydrogenase
MSEYVAPLKDMKFVLHELADLSEVAKLPGHAEATRDTVDAILEEAARFAAEVLDPLNQPGDREGSSLSDGRVRTPKGFREAYLKFAEGGWVSLPFEPDWGGQGLPKLVATPVDEMWTSANMSFSLCPLLTQGAVHALLLRGSPALQRTFMPRMVAGEWTGTMNLTEPQAGSDLALVKTRALREGDHYRISGQKIFITYGEHDFTEQIVHLVLARTPDAPEGVKGISLFVVPKLLVQADGALGERNGVRCVSLEHKLGIHASPTAVMAYDDAVGYLVGEENRGLEYMFIMMNAARFGVGLEGVAIAERAFQRALAFAKERLQGRDLATGRTAPIIRHPDVRRMLMLMKSQTEAMRALAYVVAASLDFAHKSPDPEMRKRHQAFVDLMIPVVKGWSTETGIEIASLGLQIHGGMGFIEETGAAQHLRDARITTIYEGTTGIQALDLLGRKVLQFQGVGLRHFLLEISAFCEKHAEDAELTEFIGPLAAATKAWSELTMDVAKRAATQPDEMGAAAYDYLFFSGYVALAYFWARSVATAKSARADIADAKTQTARFYFARLLPRIGTHAGAIRAGASTLLDIADSAF